MKALLFSYLLVIFLCCNSAAQIQNDIQTQNSSRAADRTVIRGEFLNWSDGVCMVELRNQRGGAPVARQTCGENGFEFNDVPRGDYVVIVEIGKDDVREEVSAHTSNTDVTVVLPRDNREMKPSAGGTVSINELKVPMKAQRLLDKANDQLQHTKLQDAEKSVGKALTIAPSYCKALAFAAVVRLAQQDRDGAMSYADRAVQSDPTLPYAQFVRAMVLNSLGRFAEAKQAAEQGLRTDQQSWQGHYELAQAFYGTSDPAKALAEVTRAEQSAPAGFAAVPILRTILLIKTHCIEEAKRELSKIDKLKTNDPRAAALHQMVAQAQP